MFTIAFNLGLVYLVILVLFGFCYLLGVMGLCLVVVLAGCFVRLVVTWFCRCLDFFGLAVDLFCFVLFCLIRLI